MADQNKLLLQVELVKNPGVVGKLRAPRPFEGATAPYCVNLVQPLSDVSHRIALPSFPVSGAKVHTQPYSQPPQDRSSRRDNAPSRK